MSRGAREQLLRALGRAAAGGEFRGSIRDAARDTLPFLATALNEVPAPTNRLDVRSGGEGGTTPGRAYVWPPKGRASRSARRWKRSRPAKVPDLGVIGRAKHPRNAS